MFFSIVIPIYNVARYIERGFESLKEQTFRDFEVILVDDGSTDGSRELCEKLAARHDFVSLYSQPNSGSGPARNLGISKAKGKYVTFFDIDDVLRPSALNTIYEALHDDESIELLMFGYHEIDSFGMWETDFGFGACDYHSNTDFRNDYVEKYSGLRFNNGFVWNKVYKRQFLIDHNIHFEALRIQQDEVFNLSTYPKLTRIRVIDAILYDYYVYHSGNTASRYIPERLDIYKRVNEAFLNLYSTWPLENSRFRDYIDRRYLQSVIQHIKYNLFKAENGLSYRQRNRLLKDIGNESDTHNAMMNPPENMPCNTRIYCKLLSRHQYFLFHIARYLEDTLDILKLIKRRAYD